MGEFEFFFCDVFFVGQVFFCYDDIIVVEYLMVGLVESVWNDEVFKDINWECDQSIDDVYLFLFREFIYFFQLSGCFSCDKFSCKGVQVEVNIEEIFMLSNFVFVILGFQKVNILVCIE